MRTRLFIAILVILDCLRIAAQSSDTYLKTFDPNPSNMWVADKAANVWSIGSYIYLVNGYLNPNDARIQQIFKINVNTREIVKQIGLTGPEIDLAITEPAGYCLTADQHILLTGEWRDYINSRMRTFIAKLDQDLNVLWINYYPDLSDLNVYADAIAETPSGDILVYLTEGKPKSLQEPWINVESAIRIVKTDADGNLLFNKVIPDTLKQTVGYGHLSRTDDDHYLLSSVVVGLNLQIPSYGLYRYNALAIKIDENANTVWSRFINPSKPLLQEPTSIALPGGGGAIMWSRDTIGAPAEVKQIFMELTVFDESGNTSWRHGWLDLSSRFFYRLISASNGDILGVSYYSQGYPTKGKTMIFRASPTEGILWERYYSDSIQRPWSPQLEMLDLCELSDGRIAATGIVFDTNSVGSLNYNIGVLLVGADGCLEPGCTGLTQYTTGTFESVITLPRLPQLVCSPNPAQDVAFLRLPEGFVTESEANMLKCYDTQGRLMTEVPWAKGMNNIPIEVKNWPSGMYQLLLWADRKPLCSGKLIVQH